MLKKYAAYIMALGAIILFYQESLPKKNVYLQLAGIIILMVGIIQLSSKIPSKNQQKDEDDVSKGR